MKTLTKTLLLGASAAILATTALAQIPTVTVDEFGNGILNGQPLPRGLVVDPISGITTLGYFLPFGPVNGDVVLLEPIPPATGTNTISDVLRFVNYGTNGILFFFSDVSTNDPADSLADVGLPQLGQLPTVGLNEIGPEGNNGATYLAAAGGPGSVLFSGGPVQYNFISDGIIPEPGSILLGILGGGLLLLLNQRRRSRRG